MQGEMTARFTRNFSSPTDSAGRLRVKMASTVERRLRQRGEPEFLRVARDLADERVGRQEATHTYPDGYVQSRRRKSGRHYHTRFKVETQSSGGDFPVSLVGSNDHHAARIIEKGRRGGYVITPRRRKVLLYPGSGGEAVFTKKATAGGPVPGKFVLRDAMRIAVRRASR